jgi:hypothetical protein
MKTRKIPLRMCVVTREKYEKRELLRIVRTPSGKVLIDDSGKMNGKGAYLKKDAEVINKARKNKILNKVLEVDIEDSLYDEMLKSI